MTGHRIPLSPAEKASRIRKVGQALKQGVPDHVLMRRRGFTRAEILAARSRFGIPALAPVTKGWHEGEEA